MPEQHAFAPTAATLGVTNSEEPGPRLMTITGTPNSPTIPRANAVTSDVNEARSSDRHVVPARDVEGGTPRKPRAEKAVEAPAPTAARFRVQFPVKRQTDDVVIETPLMIRTANRTLSLHHGSPLVVWTGPSRNGKTWTAKWLRDNINSAAENDPNGFRAEHFEYGGDTSRGGPEMKRVIRSVYHAVISKKLDEGLYRQSPPEGLALHLVEGLRAKNIQMLMVDEAGLLKLGGLRALVLIRDVAEGDAWPLSVVLIGMDNLPADIALLPQIERRVHDWCYFEPYSLEQTYELIVGLDPQFAKISLDVPAQRDMIAFIHQSSGGLPGLLAPFLRKLHSNQSMMNEPLSLTLLRIVHMMTDQEHQKAKNAASTEYKLVGVPSKRR